MPTVTATQSAIDTQLATQRAGTLDPQQTLYRSTRRKFFQGIITTDLDALPNNTDLSTLQTMVPNLTRKPTDQAEDWTAFGLSVASLSYAVEIHNYGGPRGEGWVILVYFKHDGRVFQRVINVGQESYRDTQWREVRSGIA